MADVHKKVRKWADLTIKERRFAEEYLKDFNGTQAILRAGYNAKTENTAHSMAQQNLRKPAIMAAIKEKVEELSRKNQTELDRIFLEAKRLGFSDPGRLFDKDGKLIPVKDLPEDVRAAIASFKVREIWEGKGESRVFVGYETEIKFWDKNSALDKLSRYHALYKDAGTPENPLTIHNVDLRKLSVAELKRIKENPDLILSTSN